MTRAYRSKMWNAEPLKEKDWIRGRQQGKRKGKRKGGLARVLQVLRQEGLRLWGDQAARGLASVEEEEGIDEGSGEINGFVIAALDKDEENEWQEVVRRRSHVRAVHGCRNPRGPPSNTSTWCGGGWLEQGQPETHHDRLWGGRVGDAARHVAGGANQVITGIACRDALHRSQRWDDAEPRREARQVPHGRRPELKRAFPGD